MACRATPRRNERCPCGSGRKFKVCCGTLQSTAKRSGAIPTASTPTAESVLRSAEHLLRAGEYEQALGPLVEGARLLPRNAALLSDLGKAYLFAQRLPEAIKWLRRAIDLQPTRAHSHFNLGLAMEQSGDFTKAFESYRRAVALDPQLAEAHGRMADILRRGARRDEAATAYCRAFAASPKTTFGRLCEAKAMVALDRAGEAENRLKLLLAREESTGEPSRWRAEAHLLLGHVMSNSGRFDEAAEHFERSLALAPGQPTAYQGLVSSRRLTEADRPLLSRIITRLEAGDTTDHQRMTLHFAAGKALDDLKDYACAMQHFEAANRIRQTLSSFDGRRFQGRVDRMMERFTSDLFTRHAKMAGGDETPVLIVGMPRSGTTLVERIVSSHPRVAGGGELVYWNRLGVAWGDAPIEKLAENAERIRAGYLAVLRGIGPGALRVTDKMPFNFLWIGLVHLLWPNARIIHCRRNPIDTCLSIYVTQFNENFGFASERGDLVFYYRQYLRLMDHWRSVLPSTRLLELDYEDATAAPEETARRLLEFCGLSWDEACLRPERNDGAVRTASVWQARQPIYRSSVERWRNYEPWLGELRTLAPG
jgi:tetratricopeptide (TPR) repeat protein